MELKYIVCRNNNAAIIFPSWINHSDVASGCGHILSAGQCRISIENGEFRVSCFGESKTLNKKVHPEDETLIFLQLSKSKDP